MRDRDDLTPLPRLYGARDPLRAEDLMPADRPERPRLVAVPPRRRPGEPMAVPQGAEADPADNGVRTTVAYGLLFFLFVALELAALTGLAYLVEDLIR